MRRAARDHRHHADLRTGTEKTLGFLPVDPAILIDAVEDKAELRRERSRAKPPVGDRQSVGDARNPQILGAKLLPTAGWRTGGGCRRALPRAAKHGQKGGETAKTAEGGSAGAAKRQRG